MAAAQFYRVPEITEGSCRVATLFRVWLENPEAQPLELRFGAGIVHGDPEGIRTPDLHRDKVAC